jgi:hypothetical protein
VSRSARDLATRALHRREITDACVARALLMRACMRWLLVFAAASGCAFFEPDNKSGHPPVADAAVVVRCTGMHYTGETCAADPPCVWSEGYDGGIAAEQCTCTNGHWACTDACPATPPGTEPCSDLVPACSYAESNGHVQTCQCAFGTWRCSDCPDDFKQPTATCTPGDSCFYNDWEHGCDCTCASVGKWDCIPQTLGSMCPSTHVDAGI